MTREHSRRAASKPNVEITGNKQGFYGKESNYMDHEQFDFSNESPLSPINVLVCDNESLFREILVAALDKEPIINIVGAAASGLEAI